MNMFANFCYDKDIMGKEKYEIRDDNKDCVAINMVKHVKNKRRIVILLTVKIMTKKLLNDEEQDYYCFMNNSKYQYIVVTKSNALYLEKIIIKM